MPPQPNPAKHWCFTLNNYDDGALLKIRNAFDAGGISYLIFGKEVGATGTPHLQGFVSFKKKLRLAPIIALVGQAHWTIARNVRQSIEYCKKDGDVTEYGAPPNVPGGSGERTDLLAFRAAVEEGMVDPTELRAAFPVVMARYRHFALSTIRDFQPLPPIPDHELLPWQQLLVDSLDGEPNPRTITFVIDEVGNKGKSWFCSYCEKTFERVQIMKCGKRDDMAFELQENVRTVIIDVSRSQSEFLNYQFLEDLKDGRVFSPKYESYTKRFNSPHVIVMMNETPNESKLSADRYNMVVVN